MAERNKGQGRIGRATKLGGVAAGHAARTVGTRTANLVRSDEKADAANARQLYETADRLVTVLGTMKGAAMKLGQTFSVLDVGLVPPEHREEFQRKLAKLQASAEPVPFKDMKKVLEQDLGGKLSDHFDDFGEEPIAAASIGQVHRATTDDGRDVAVKVQYPGVKEAVRSDLQNLGIALKILARLSPGLDTKEVANEIRDRITEELDYELEAANHRAVAREYRGHPFIVVPDVITDLCRERVITTEFVEGRRFEEIVKAPQEERDRFGEILARFYLNGPFRHRLLNGDPHPGNSLFLDDGRIACLDFGFFKKLTAEEQTVQIEVLRAVYHQDGERMYELMRQQGVVESGGEAAIQQLMTLYNTICGWFLEDDVVTVSPHIMAAAVAEHGKLARGGFGDMKLPADQIVAARSYVLTMAIMSQLGAANNYFRIGREVIFDEPPVTELGKIEADYLGCYV